MREITIDWNKFKTEVVAAGLPVFYEEVARGTRVWAHEVSVTWVALLTSESDVVDFQENYAALWNKPGAESLHPVQILSSNAFQMQANAVSVEVAAGQTGSVDFKIENYSGENFTSKYLNGAEIYCSNASVGDWAEAQIVDVDNILGYGANTVLKSYVKKMFIFPNVRQVITASAPGQIPVGLYIRIVYHSTGATSPVLYVNYDIELKG